MTGSTKRPGAPGTTFLKIARLLFNDHVLSAIVEPTISDLQREIAEAGPSRAKRVRARYRGYRAFWMVALVAPFAFRAPPPVDAGGVAFPDAIARLALGSIVFVLLAAFGPFLGVWIAGVTAAGALIAIVIHRWYERHPSEMPIPAEPQRYSPQINFSSTEIAGNVGGLIFAVGSVFIVVVGVPSVIVFLVAATMAGCVLAWGLAAWHTAHPKWGVPENRIVWR